MQFTAVTLLALVAGVLGLPPNANQDLDLDQFSPRSDLELESQSPCGPLMRKAVCCRKSLFGAIDFGCHRPKPAVHTGPELDAACALTGKTPRCCILGILGNYAPCKTPPSIAKDIGQFNNTEDDIEPIGIDYDWDWEIIERGGGGEGH